MNGKNGNKGKQEIFKMVLGALETKIGELQESYNSAKQAAIEGECAMQSRYASTREESSYLADGLASILSEKYFDLDKVRSTRFDPFYFHVKMGSLVTLMNLSDRTEKMYFLLPAGGGTTVEYKKSELMVISPQSPLAKEMYEKEIGYQFEFKAKKYFILKIE